MDSVLKHEPEEHVPARADGLVRGAEGGRRRPPSFLGWMAVNPSPSGETQQFCERLKGFWRLLHSVSCATSGLLQTERSLRGRRAFKHGLICLFLQTDSPPSVPQTPVSRSGAAPRAGCGKGGAGASHASLRGVTAVTQARAAGVG